jgi:drug/metabolite transporter (DMT)-like permease
MENSRVVSRPVSRWRFNDAFLAEFTFVLVVAVWGITYLFTRDALTVVGPFAYNTVRMLLGGLTLALLTGRAWKSLNRDYAWPALLTGVVLFGGYSAQAIGQQYTTVAKAAFLTSTYLIYVPLFSALVLGRRPAVTAILGVLLAFSGLVFLSLEGSVFTLTFSRGDIWVASSGIGWALYFILLSRYSGQLNIMLYATLHVTVAALCSAVAWLLMEPLTLPLSSGPFWLGILATGLLIIGLGTSIHTWVSRLASPTRIALIATLEPVFAALAGWFVGEPLTARLLVGGAMILAGVTLAEVAHLRRPGFSPADESLAANPPVSPAFADALAGNDTSRQ